MSCNNQRSHPNQQGFALAVLAAIMLVTSVLVISATQKMQPLRDYAAHSKTSAKLSKIADALTAYVTTYSRLPCPASPTSILGDSTYGLESRDSSFECNATSIFSNITAGSKKYMGAVPVTTLGLENDMGVDAWGNKIEYVVSDSAYKTSIENSSLNFFNSTPILEVQSKDGTSLTSQASYILISRGANQLNAWNANSSSIGTRSAISHLETENTECSTASKSLSCGGVYFDNIFKVSNVDFIDDLLLYGEKDKLLQDCQNASYNNQCNVQSCETFGDASNWSLSSKTYLSVTPSNFPYIDISMKPKTDFIYNFSATLDSISIASTYIYLMYDYELESAPGKIFTSTIAFFSTNGFQGAFNSSYLGKTINVPFGDSGHIPRKLYFQSPGTGTSKFSMQLSNVNIQTRPLYKSNELYYNIWDNISCPLTNSGGSGTRADCSTIKYLLSDSRYPSSPTYTSRLSTAEGFTNYIYSGYGSQISGYFTPDESTNYTFYVASNQVAILYFSTDSNPANVKQVSYNDKATKQREWSNSDVSASSPIALEAGQSYYFSLIHVAGGDTNGNFVGLGCNTTNSAKDVMTCNNNNAVCAGTFSTAPIDSLLMQKQCQ